MEKQEKRWLFFLIGVFVVVNIITLSPLVPWQKWILWSDPEPTQTVSAHFVENEIQMEKVQIAAGEFIQFSATSADVTYGFGVFRKDNSMVFQMQVLPGRENEIIWKFDEPGFYDVRSTEYSGPLHSEMHLTDVIEVIP